MKHIVHVIGYDATQKNSFIDKKYDKILVDVPCSSGD